MATLTQKQVDEFLQREVKVLRDRVFGMVEVCGACPLTFNGDFINGLGDIARALQDISIASHALSMQEESAGVVAAFHAQRIAAEIEASADA